MASSTDLAARASEELMGSGFDRADDREDAEPRTAVLLIDWLLAERGTEEHRRLSEAVIERARERGVIPGEAA